jgi:crotonobetainyl-CoA:carnitine CoA-transferase CaiB-like acyl-CoA transferase
LSAPPLDGIDVIDLTRLLPGAYCSALLARLGARVTVVEEPGERDPLAAIERRMGGRGDFARTLRAGQQARTIDLDSDAGRRRLATLLRKADVLLESPRPASGEDGRQAGGVRGRGLERAIDAAVAAAANRRLVRCALTAGGIQGRLAARRGHDLGLLAMSGVLDLLRGADGTPAVPGVQIAGVGATAMPAVQAILAALLARARDGRGRRIVVSTLHHLATWTAFERSVAAPSAGRPPARVPAPGGPGDDAPARTVAPSALRGRLPCYNIYRTADDRHLVVAGVQPRLWEAFCTAVERPDWVARQDDPALVETVRELIASRRLAAWLDLARAHGLCLEAVAGAHAAWEMIDTAGAGGPGEVWLPGVWCVDADDAP